MEFMPAISAQASDTREISSRAMHTEVRSPPGPPYSSGTQSCISPMSPKRWKIRSGILSVASTSVAIGRISLSTMRRMPSRIASWVSVK